MPYRKITDLPESVQKHLPKHAQEIYLEAFNNAWKQYDGNEVTAHKVAWSAVKKEYVKNEEGKWIKK